MSTHFKAASYAAVLAVIATLIPPGARAGEIGTPITANGFTFINFDPFAPGTSRARTRMESAIEAMW